MHKSLVVLVLVAGCGGPPPSSAPVRFVDVFSEAVVEGTPETADANYAPTSWRFDEDELDWRAAQGVEGLRIEDGVMRGQTSSDQPVLIAANTGEVPASEMLYAVEVRARVSAGTLMEVRFSGPELVLPATLGNPLIAFTTPIRPGDEMQTYLIRATSNRSPEEMAHVLLIPTNEADAEFEIESIRLIFRGEHLRSIASGVGWHGMSEIYNEAIVTRAPERVRYEVELPAEPFLELGLATIEPAPVTFRVEVGDRVLETVIDEPNVWHAASLDLEGMGGQSVAVTLSIDAAEPGTLGFWGAPAIRSNAAPENQPQAVILIITDTLRSDHLDLYGYGRETAPTLTRIAGEGVWFEDTVSQATWTKVSVTAIQTSLYPTTHTVEDIPDRLPASAATIAEAYRAAGYATLALTSIPFVGQLTNLHQGYEVLHESGSLQDWETLKSSPEYVSRLLPWMESHRDTPFFALLHIADPHSPFRPTEDFETTFAEPGDMDELDALTEQVRPHIQDPIMKQFGMPTTSELVEAKVDPELFVRHETNGMDGSIRGMDDALAKVFAKLDELGLSDRALVAVVSDHGTELLEHDQHFHGHSVYGELSQVPMMLWGPSYVPAGRRVETTVQTIDLMPTMLELSGLPASEAAQGQSLTSLFEEGGEARWNRPAITELLPNLRFDSVIRSVISDGWKLVRFDDEGEGEPRFELYAHRDDPLNLDDVADEHPEIVERLAELLKNWRLFAEAARLDDEAATSQLDSAELERLRSLGYIQ